MEEMNSSTSSVCSSSSVNELAGSNLLEFEMRFEELNLSEHIKCDDSSSQLQLLQELSNIGREIQLHCGRLMCGDVSANSNIEDYIDSKVEQLRNITNRFGRSMKKFQKKQDDCKLPLSESYTVDKDNEIEKEQSETLPHKNNLNISSEDISTKLSPNRSENGVEVIYKKNESLCHLNDLVPYDIEQNENSSETNENCLKSIMLDREHGSVEKLYSSQLTHSDSFASEIFPKDVTFESDSTSTLSETLNEDNSDGNFAFATHLNIAPNDRGNKLAISSLKRRRTLKKCNRDFRASSDSSLEFNERRSKRKKRKKEFIESKLLLPSPDKAQNTHHNQKQRSEPVNCMSNIYPLNFTSMQDTVTEIDSLSAYSELSSSNMDKPEINIVSNHFEEDFEPDCQSFETIKVNNNQNFWSHSFSFATYCVCQLLASAEEEESKTPIQPLRIKSEPVDLQNDFVYNDGVDLFKYLKPSDDFSAMYLKSLSPLMVQEHIETDLLDDNQNPQRMTREIGKNDCETISLLQRPNNIGSPIPWCADGADEEQERSPITDFNILKNSNEPSLFHGVDDITKAITEIEYLQRCNEKFKLELLADSSDASLQDESNDKFLTSYLSATYRETNVSSLSNRTVKLEFEDKGGRKERIPETANISNKNVSYFEGINTHEKIKVKNNTDETEVEIATDKESDFEILDGNFGNSSRKRPISLDKMYESPRKRQKIKEELTSSDSEKSSFVSPVVPRRLRSTKPMLRPAQLQRETLKAQKHERERIRRLEKRHTMLEMTLRNHPELVSDRELVLDYIAESETFIKVHPELVKLLKPHQREGVRFMYESVYGDLESEKENRGSGCILAHCMGLGKTLQLITLIHTAVSFEALNTRKILVLCPKSTVMNWGDEMARWLRPLECRSLKVYAFNDAIDINAKIQIMRKWSSSSRAGCLLMGYEAFRSLVFYHKNKERKDQNSPNVEAIGDKIFKYLLDPGADLVVCDEGHIIKNSKSAISMAVSEIKTPRRIVLTGTPMQNNLKEYYSMVNFVKPLYLGTEREFANLYANPIASGQHADSSQKEIKIMKQRSYVLHKKLSKIVQRKEPELLKTFLPAKFEYVLFIPMTDIQSKLYERALQNMNRERNLIVDYTTLRKIWTHPKVFDDAWKNTAQAISSNVDGIPGRIDWWRHLVDEKDINSILTSNKLRALFEILRMCEEKGDKCLIFSAFVAVLNVVEYFFQMISRGDQNILNALNLPESSRSLWELNKDYYRLDGQTSKSKRHDMIYNFNDPTNIRTRVFLISARAGGQGINLTGANRVIILDTSWNPSNDQQNIFRVFRLGQRKICYIYRLLAMGTMEEKVYSRSVTKQAMSFRVVDEQQIDRHYKVAELSELYVLTKPNLSERPTPIVPQDDILAIMLRNFPDLVYKYHEHDSLLENKMEQELSEQEKNDAWESYEHELQIKASLLQKTNSDDLTGKEQKPHEGVLQVKENLFQNTNPDRLTAKEPQKETLLQKTNTDDLTGKEQEPHEGVLKLKENLLQNTDPYRLTAKEPEKETLLQKINSDDLTGMEQEPQRGVLQVKENLLQNINPDRLTAKEPEKETLLQKTNTDDLTGKEQEPHESVLQVKENLLHNTNPDRLTAKELEKETLLQKPNTDDVTGKEQEPQVPQEREWQIKDNLLQRPNSDDLTSKRQEPLKNSCIAS